MITFLIIALATWRIANLLSDTTQGGPFGILNRLRYTLGVRFDEQSKPTAKPGSLGEGILCVFCSSIWIGIGFSILYYFLPALCLFVALPLALSATAILIEEHR